MAVNPPPASSGSGKQSITQTLRSKAMGLPVWAWGLILVVLLALYLWRKKSQTASTAATAGTASTASTTAGMATSSTGSQQSDNGAAYLAGLQAGQTTPATAATPGGVIYGPTTGGTYVPITGGYTGVAAASAAGETIYYQPAGQGTPWVAIPASQIYPGSGYNNTAIFVPSSTPAAGGSGGGEPIAGRTVPVRATQAAAPDVNLGFLQAGAHPAQGIRPIRP